jgi:hypothetical protein
VNDDLSATKAFRFRESGSFQLRADIFNLFQHFNPDPTFVVNAFNSATFGQITKGTYATRIIQLAGKLYF